MVLGEFIYTVIWKESFRKCGLKRGVVHGKFNYMKIWQDGVRKGHLKRMVVLSEFIAWRYRNEGFRKRFLKRGRGPWSGVCLIDWLMIASYSTLSWADSLHLHVVLHECLAFYSAFLNIHRSGVLTALAWLVPHEWWNCSCLGASSVYTIQPCTMSLHAKPHT